MYLLRHPLFTGFLPLLLCVALALPAISTSAAAQPSPGELLRNGGFEGGSGSNGRGAGVPRWEAFEAGYDIDRQTHRDGDQSIRCDSLRTQTLRGAMCRIEVNQTRPIPILVAGWSKAEKVGGSADADYSVYVDLEYTDGTTLWGQSAAFRVGTHDWERRQVLLYPKKPIRSLSVYALFRRHVGTAWFDDFEAHPLEGDGIFDGQVLSLPVRPAPSARPLVTVAGKDGLSLAMNAQGDVVRVRAGGREVQGSLPGGFFVRDAAKDGAAGQPIAARGAASAYHGTGVNFFSSPPGMGIRFYAKIVPDGDSLLVDGELTDTTGTDRAVTVYFALPVAADGWTWGQDVRHDQVLDAHQEAANLTRVNVGATGGLSAYPFACISNYQSSVAIASQMDWPSVYRIFYNGPTHQMVMAWDFALTGKTAAWPSHNARFRCTLFQLPGGQNEWGFRAAAQRFYKINAPNYDRRARAEGIWMPFTDPSKVEKPADFGFAYHEGDNSVASDDTLGILSFRYTEPMSWWMPMPPEMPRTYEAALGLARKFADDKAPKDRALSEMARALFNSGTWDVDGKFNVQFRNEPWANGAVFVMNPNPELPSGPDKPTRSSLAYTVADAIKRYNHAVNSSGDLDGEYLDSLEGWADTLDFRPESLQACPYPIPFDTESRKPAVPEWYHTHTFTRFLRDDLHNRGKLLMANSTPIRFSAFSPLLDIMGIEVNWLDGSGNWSPESDETMILRRTLSYQKPYLLLQNTNFDKFTAPLVEKYFQRSMFYGIYPSMFSADAATKAYWDTPKWYNRDRSLFQTYIPIIKRLSSAGWEPVTYARANNAQVYTERFGSRFFTVLNNSHAAQDCVLTVDLARLHLSAERLDVRNIRTGASVPSRVSNSTLTITLKLAADEVAVLELK